MPLSPPDFLEEIQGRDPSNAGANVEHLGTSRLDIRVAFNLKELKGLRVVFFEGCFKRGFFGGV